MVYKTSQFILISCKYLRKMSQKFDFKFDPLSLNWQNSQSNEILTQQMPTPAKHFLRISSHLVQWFNRIVN